MFTFRPESLSHKMSFEKLNLYSFKCNSENLHDDITCRQKHCLQIKYNYNASKRKKAVLWINLQPPPPLLSPPSLRKKYERKKSKKRRKIISANELLNRADSAKVSKIFHLVVKY